MLPNDMPWAKKGYVQAEEQLEVKAAEGRESIAKAAACLLYTSITPCGAQTETDYELEVAGVKVTSKNCSDLSVIEGVSGRVGYDPYENYLFLYDAKIESKNGVPVVLAKKDVEIFVVGNCTLSAENAPCIVYDCLLYTSRCV